MRISFTFAPTASVEEPWRRRIGWCTDCTGIKVQRLLLNSCRGTDHQQANPFEPLKDATHRRAPGLFAALVGRALPMRLQRGAHLVLRQRIDRQCQPHHHAQRDDALGTVHEQTVGAEQQGLQETTSPFRSDGLPLVDPKRPLGRQPLSIRFIGRPDALPQPPFRLGNHLRPLHHLPFQAPADPLERCVRGRTPLPTVGGHVPLADHHLVRGPCSSQPPHGLLGGLPRGTVVAHQALPGVLGLPSFPNTGVRSVTHSR